MSDKNADTKKYKKKKKCTMRQITGFIFRIILILICIGLIGGLFLANSKFGINIKNIQQWRAEAVTLVENSTKETFMTKEDTVIYSNDETEIAKLYVEEESSYLEYADIPEDVINAFVSVEDRTFWENPGIDLKGIARVLVNYVRTSGETAHGASTITQQVARDIFLTNEKSIVRKVKEIFIALEMTKKYDKDVIIEFYCNNCCFANATYGIEDASQTYFSKPASELTLSEAAYLCAIPNRPEYYNPLKDASTALERRDKILGDMFECGYITEAQLNEALAQEITINPKESKRVEFHNYATTLAIDCATEYLMDYKYGFDFKYGFKNQDDYEAYKEEYQTTYDKAKRSLYTDGYTIYTSIDLAAIDALQDVVDEGLDWSSKTKEDGIYDLQGALSVIDNETGKIVAVVGGRSQEDIENIYSLNRAIQSPRQPGSTIKPLLVYTPALINGYEGNSELTNISVKDAKGKSEEEIAEMTGSKVKLRRAVEKSENGTAYWLAAKIGINNGMDYLEKMGFSHLAPSDYMMSAALGGMTYGATTTEMANAYSTLVNHGIYQKADCITSIIDRNGNEIYKNPRKIEVYTKEASDEMIDILKGVITKGTASSMRWSRVSDIEAAGKTGTTNDSRDGWFCGVTPYYTISVWIGSDTNEEIKGLSGGNYPSQIWKNAMLVMTEDLPSAEFDIEVEPEWEEKEELPAEESEKTEDTEIVENAESDKTETEDGTVQEKPSTNKPAQNETSNIIDGVIIEPPTIPETPTIEPVIPEPTVPEQPETSNPEEPEQDSPEKEEQTPAPPAERPGNNIFENDDGLSV